jgi:MULE transposase domain
MSKTSRMKELFTSANQEQHLISLPNYSRYLTNSNVKYHSMPFIQFTLLRIRVCELRMKYAWTLLHSNLSEMRINEVLDQMKTCRAYTTQHMRCQLCAEEMSNLDNHKMKYRVLRCSSTRCGEMCSWFLKIITCDADNTGTKSQMFQHGAHETEERSPPRKKMKRAAKAFVKELTQRCAKPARIQAEMVGKYPQISPAELPTLAQIQRVSYHFRKSSLVTDKRVRTLNELISANLFDATCTNPAEPFAFGYTADLDGRPCVGRGTNDAPTFVGVSSRALLGRLRLASEHTLHIDATFKLNQSNFPVIVIGISDKRRSFHLVATFITSQLTAPFYKRALTTLFDTYGEVIGGEPHVSRVMSDADDASFNAFDTMFADRNLPRPQHLMCFFHVMMNVKKHSTRLTKSERRMIKNAVYDMHFSRSDGEFQAHAQHGIETWRSGNEMIARFATYFEKEWITSRFNKWSCHHSPSGTAKTNNPVEQFNRVIKRDYSLGTLLPVSTLFEKLLLVVRTKSTFLADVASTNSASADMLRRYNYLNRASLLQISVPSRASMVFMLEGRSNEVVVSQTGVVDPNTLRTTKSKGKTKFFGPGNMRQNKFEIIGQPSRGWVVDTEFQTCPCAIRFKFGFCPHIIAAMKERNRDIPGHEAEECFVNRYQLDRQEPVRVRAGGRPPRVGPALSFV